MAKKVADMDIEDILAKLDKEFQPPEQLPRVKSNLLSLDIVLGGQGIPLGKTIEISSDSGVGKSTMLLHVARNLCMQGYRVVWIDTESATDPEFLDKMRLTEFIETGMFRIYQEATFAAVEKILDTLIPTGQIPFIVIDSLANMTSESKVVSTVFDKANAKSIDTNQVAGDARYQTSFMKKYKFMANKYQTTIFFVNQFRQFIPTSYGQVAKTVSSGAKAVRYNMDCCIELLPAGKIKGKRKTINGEEEINIGSNVNFFIREKSRICDGGIKVPGAIYFGQGFSNIATIAILMEKKQVEYNGKYVKMLNKVGSSYTLTFGGEQMKVMYQSGLREAITKNYDTIMSEFDASDFNVVQDDLNSAADIDINEDSVNFDENEVVYNSDGTVVDSGDNTDYEE